MLYDKPENNVSPKREEEILEFWKQDDTFKKSIKLREGAPKFVFFDGPPTANGVPHPGHVLTKAMKDLIPRYKTMRGFQVNRKAGWDTHGLPVELEVEKMLGLESKKDTDQEREYKNGCHQEKKCSSNIFCSFVFHYISTSLLRKNRVRPIPISIRITMNTREIA